VRGRRRIKRSCGIDDVVQRAGSAPVDLVYGLEDSAPFRYGLGVRASAVLPFGFLYGITAIESIGDITATSSLTGEPIAGPIIGGRPRSRR
jgi:hypothetical protein